MGYGLNGTHVMPYLARSVKEIMARLLEPDEREAVMGDLAEMGASSWRSSVEILGLIVRRQATHWSRWLPWFAAFGLSLPGTLLLQGASFSISCTYQGLTGAELCAGWSPTGREHLALLPCLAVLLSLASWSLGFLTRFVSRPIFWASATLAALPCIYCQLKFHEAAVPRLSLLLFLPPMLAGAHHGLRGAGVKPVIAVALTALSTVSIVVFERVSHMPWTSNWALLLPVWCVALLAFRPDLFKAPQT